MFEWAADLFKRTTSIDDKEAIVSAIKTTKLDTCLGTIDFTAPVKANTHHPHPNVCYPPEAAAQWIKATSGKWRIDKVPVFTTDPNLIAVKAKTQPITYS